MYIMYKKINEINNCLRKNTQGLITIANVINIYSTQSNLYVFNIYMPLSFQHSKV